MNHSYLSFCQKSHLPTADTLLVYTFLHFAAADRQIQLCVAAALAAERRVYVTLSVENLMSNMSRV